MNIFLNLNFSHTKYLTTELHIYRAYSRYNYASPTYGTGSQGAPILRLTAVVTMIMCKVSYCGVQTAPKNYRAVF